jgi:Flp pilus assembly protein TadG
MRVRRFSLIRVRNEERGAVLAIVAITLICLLGMLVLTFDLGRGVALKRNMVNGADAAALAAAMECGLAHGEVAARQEATNLLTDNNGAATILPGTAGFQINPGPAQCDGVPSPDPDHNPTVTVTVSVPQEYFFAPIFGINNGTVVATATAEWTVGATNPAPIKIDQLKVEQCLAEGEPDPEGKVDCYFTFEKGPSPLNSSWGWLNLPEGWPIKDQDPNPKNCSPQKGGSNDLVDYIGGMGGMGTPGDPTLLPGLWDPTGAGNPPTWVCGATGHKAVSVEAMNEWVDNVKTLMDKKELESEPVVLFPIVACDPAKTPGDPDCREWKFSPGVAYPVVKLQGFYVKEAWDGQQARKQPNCHFTRKSADVFCIHLQTTGLDEGSSSGRPLVRLVD